MIYFIYGSNTYHALKKIHEFKEFFLTKGNPANGQSNKFLIEEFDGDVEDQSLESITSSLEQGSLFVGKRLLVFKNIIKKNNALLDILIKRGATLKMSKDILVFWESESNEAVYTFFKKYSEKIQEVARLTVADLDKWLEKRAAVFGLALAKRERMGMIEVAGENAEFSLENEMEKKALNGVVEMKSDLSPELKKIPKTSGTLSPFPFVEKIFSEKGNEALLTLKKAILAGHIQEKLIYPLLWKAKQKHMRGAYKKGIIAESQMRKDPKNSYEHMERFILTLKV